MSDRHGLTGQVSIVVEGAVDHFCGQPLHANPYCETYAVEAWHCWRFGWQEADFYLDLPFRALDLPHSRGA